VNGLKERAAAAGSSLRVPNYRLYFVGQSVSAAGTFMQTLATSFLVLHLTGSGTDVGIAAGARFLPFVLLGPFGGVLADRADKRRLLYVTQSASGAAALVFAILAATGTATYPAVVALSLVLGCLTVLDNPARQSFIAELVPRETLANAVALNSVSLNVARIAGSVVGGALVATVGIAWCFAINAASFAAVIINLARMRTDTMQVVARAPRARGQVRAGFRYAVRTPELALPLVMLTVTGVLAYEFPTTLPLLATGAFHGTAATYGIMAAVMAGGAVVGGIVAASRPAPRRATALAWTAIGWGVAILAAGIAPDLPLTLIALVFVGYGTITFNSSAKTALQLAARPDMRGRVMALWALAWGGSTVIGAPIVGWVAETFGSRWSLVVGGVPTIVLGFALLPSLKRQE
jgi:MFS family permease